jgi:hypothetical protein
MLVNDAKEPNDLVRIGWMVEVGRRLNEKCLKEGPIVKKRDDILKGG